jgi:predicted DsbA family dithiol-disulfide isomerase
MTSKYTVRSRFVRLSALTAAICAASSMARAQTPRCDALGAAQQLAKQEAFATLHPYDGCDETFERCLDKKLPHRVVLRLASDVCRHIAAGKSLAEIERALAKRAQSLLHPVKPASFALDEATGAGDPGAPVHAVVYACARCPFCKVLVPALYREVKEGALAGKVRLYLRPFPLRDHPGSTEGGLAMISAARLGRFWPFVTTLYEKYDAFCPGRLTDWAAEVGMERTAFEHVLADPATREALVAAKQEGIRNKVEATPTLFIADRKYVYEMQLEVVVDVLLEAFESLTAPQTGP